MTLPPSVSADTRVEQAFHVGVTGTRRGLSAWQHVWLNNLSPWWSGNVVLHQGACLGADTEVSVSAYAGGAVIVSHPPTYKGLRYRGNGYVSHDVREPKWFHDRDRDIVHESALMLGFPDGPPRPNSGTWYTLWYADWRGVPLLICYPWGEVSRVLPPNAYRR